MLRAGRKREGGREGAVGEEAREEEKEEEEKEGEEEEEEEVVVVVRFYLGVLLLKGQRT